MGRHRKDRLSKSSAFDPTAAGGGRALSVTILLPASGIGTRDRRVPPAGSGMTATAGPKIEIPSDGIPFREPTGRSNNIVTVRRAAPTAPPEVRRTGLPRRFVGDGSGTVTQTSPACCRRRLERGTVCRIDPFRS